MRARDPSDVPQGYEISRSLLQVQETVETPTVTMQLALPNCNATTASALADAMKTQLSQGLDQEVADALSVTAVCVSQVSLLLPEPYRP